MAGRPADIIASHLFVQLGKERDAMQLTKPVAKQLWQAYAKSSAYRSTSAYGKASGLIFDGNGMGTTKLAEWTFEYNEDGTGTFTVRNRTDAAPTPTGASAVGGGRMTADELATDIASRLSKGTLSKWLTVPQTNYLMNLSRQARDHRERTAGGEARGVLIGPDGKGAGTWELKVSGLNGAGMFRIGWYADAVAAHEKEVDQRERDRKGLIDLANSGAPGAKEIANRTYRAIYGTDIPEVENVGLPEPGSDRWRQMAQANNLAKSQGHRIPFPELDAVIQKRVAGHTTSSSPAPAPAPKSTTTAATGSLKVGSKVTVVKGHNSVKGRTGTITAITGTKATVKMDHGGGRSVETTLASLEAA
jgi:hypothetical protein